MHYYLNQLITIIINTFGITSLRLHLDQFALFNLGVYRSNSVICIYVRARIIVFLFSFYQRTNEDKTSFHVNFASLAVTGRPNGLTNAVD